MEILLEFLAILMTFFPLLIPLGLLLLGYGIGNAIERKHYQDIERREKQTARLQMVNYGAKQPLPDARDSCLVVGSVVIASDYFKQFLLFWMNLFGGNVPPYESLLDRARREATLRMKAQAIAWGAHQILNVRYTTSTITGNHSQDPGLSIEVIAYGTAIRK